MPMGQHSHRNRFISTHPLGLNWTPSRSNKCCCSGQLGAGRPAVSMRQFVHGAEIAAALHQLGKGAGLGDAAVF